MVKSLIVLKNMVNYGFKILIRTTVVKSGPAVDSATAAAKIPGQRRKPGSCHRFHHAFDVGPGCIAFEAM